MATIDWSLRADLDRTGGYETDLTPYIIAPASSLSVSRGLGRDGKPRSSQLSVVLDNATGAFTAENSASPFYGLLTPGVPVQLTATHAGIAYTVITAFAMQWRAEFPIAGISTCAVECEDLFWFLANGQPVNVNASDGRTTSDALVAIATALGLTATDLRFDEGLQSLPMHFALAEEPLRAMQQVAASEMGGQLYPSADGLVRFESRAARLGIDVDDTWGRGTQVMPISETYDLNPLEFATNVTVRATVFHEGQADTLLYEDVRSMYTSPATSLALAPGEVYDRIYQAASAYVALTDLEATVDYLANAAADGSGTDQTAALDIQLTDRGGGWFEHRLQNTSTATIYVTRRRQRGQPVQFYYDQSIVQASLLAAGLKTGLSLQFDLPFSGDTDGKVRDYAYQELRVGRVPFPVLTLRFQAYLAADIAALLNVDLGDLVRYSSPPVDLFQNAMVDDWWYVEGLEYNIPADWGGEVFEVAVSLIPSYVYRNLDAIAYDEFDRSDVAAGLGQSTSGDTWDGSSGFDIVSGAAVANTDALTVGDFAVGVADQVVEVSLSAIGADDEVGLVFRKGDGLNYYRCYLDRGSSEVILERVVAGVVTELSSPALTVGATHELRVIVQGNRIRTWVDGVKLIDVTDASLSAGVRAGLFARNASGTARFAHVYAQGLNLSDGTSAAIATRLARRQRRHGRPAIWRQRMVGR